MAYRWVAWRQGQAGFGKWHLVPADEIAPPTVCGKQPNQHVAISPPTYDKRTKPRDACATCWQRAHAWGKPEGDAA